MYNVQKVYNCINIPSSKTFKSVNIYVNIPRINQSKCEESVHGQILKYYAEFHHKRINQSLKGSVSICGLYKSRTHYL
jgi:hypothetical protein